MFGSARTAVKFFVYGLVIGLLFAPRTGEETRKEVINWASDTLKGLMGGSTNG
jgi:gas vesicle protein